jgi:aspartate carbamoyltransferase catalytic subunit
MPCRNTVEPAMMAKSGAPTRHVVSINDLSNREIETIFAVAQSYLDRFADKSRPYRIARSTGIASEAILASLFYEPSTRTRLSFESAMLRLGGDFITSADPATSSAAKGESLADSVRVIANYADIMVIRHPRDGAARLAAEYSPIPVINGGDGSHEHPTQTLCDLFTLKRKNKELKNLKVAISGDLRGSRTIHSFVYALARFGARIVPMPAPGMELPDHVNRRLRDEFRCKFDTGDGSIGALYHTPDEPHQAALFHGPDFELSFKSYAPAPGRARGQKIAAVYVTRFQKERWTEKQQDYPKIDAKFLKDPKYSRASVLHPLPRVGELDAALDTDSRAIYFEQAAYGVPIRMALISLLLGLAEGKALAAFAGGFEKTKHVLYEQPLSSGMRCANRNCIVHEEKEAPYLKNKFHLMQDDESGSGRLRCLYCEGETDQFMIANRRSKWYTAGAAALAEVNHQNVKDYIFFAEQGDAIANGFHSRRHAGVKRARVAAGHS